MKFNCERMKNRREELGISQVQLAGIVMVSQAMICQIEAGRKTPSLNLAGFIAEALNISPFDLLEKEAE